ncbi:hypothetical protein [Vibrio sp. WXL103]|uniref:hypothetical protein n=1 Tax=unclassified Vibrio TaxID=2614977 RepID=UPI003EC53896
MQVTKVAIAVTLSTGLLLGCSSGAVTSSKSALFSSSATTENFESYPVGSQIDQANAAYAVANVNGSDVIATISDDQAKSGTKSLYLLDNNDTTKPVVSRAFTDGAAESGSVSTSVFIPSDGYVKSTYLYLGNSAGAASGQRFTEVVFGKNDVRFRNEAGGLDNLQRYQQDTWVDVTIAWQGTDVTVTVDGNEYSGLKAQNAVGEAPTLYALYVGDNRATNNFSYFDDIESNLF